MPQPKPRDPSRGPQAADPSSTCRQERASESKETATASAAGRRTTQRRCVLLTLIPFREARWRRKRPQGGRTDSASSLQVLRMHLQRTPEPARVVVRLHRTTDPPRAHLWAISVRAERWLGGRQPGETLHQCGDIQHAKNQRMKPDQNRSRFRGDDEAGWLTARRQPESALVVCDHAQPEPGQANQLARRAEYAQLAHAKVRQNLCA